MANTIHKILQGSNEKTEGFSAPDVLSSLTPKSVPHHGSASELEELKNSSSRAAVSRFRDRKPDAGIEAAMKRIDESREAAHAE